MEARSEVEGPGSMVQWRKMMQEVLGSENRACCCALRGWVGVLRDCGWLADKALFGRALTILSWASSHSQDRNVTSRLKLWEKCCIVTTPWCRIGIS